MVMVVKSNIYVIYIILFSLLSKLSFPGPQRKSSSLKDPEKYEFRPKQLLKQLFMEAANVLRRTGEDPRTITAFENLSMKAKAAASEAMDAEAVLGDIPDEFLDPIQYTLMKDPVILPSPRIIVDRDRPTIRGIL